MNKIRFWLECSRWYALPMSVFSWLVIFTYCTTINGNIFNGILALIGICFAHLATNLFDDFYDFNFLEKYLDENSKIVLPNTQRGKCRYLTENKVKLVELLSVVAIYCFIALCTGLFFYFYAGAKVLYFMLGGAIIIFLYPVLSAIRLSELAIATAFGSLLYGGVYYVMMGHLAVEPFILAIPTTIFTVNLLYTDTFLDKDIDKKEGKKTLVNLFHTEQQALLFQKGLITLGYLSVLLIPIFDITDWEIFVIYLTIPLAIDLTKSLALYSDNQQSIPEKKWFHFPFESWTDIKENRSETFMFRMYQARNLMVYIALILTFVIVFNY